MNKMRDIEANIAKAQKDITELETKKLNAEKLAITLNQSLTELTNQKIILEKQKEMATLAQRETEKSLKTLETTIASQEKEAQDLKKQIQDKEAEVAKLQNKLDTLNKDFSKKVDDLKLNEAAIQKLENELKYEEGEKSTLLKILEDDRNHRDKCIGEVKDYEQQVQDAKQELTKSEMDEKIKIDAHAAAEKAYIQATIQLAAAIAIAAASGPFGIFEFGAIAAASFRVAQTLATLIKAGI